MPFGPEGLAIPWVGPVPANARISFMPGTIFREADRMTGSEIPSALPRKYTQKLHYAGLFNPTLLWEAQELSSWHEKNGFKLGEEALSLLNQYVTEGYRIASILVEHPSVPKPESFAACNTVLQRGDIVYANGVQTLFLRSYFHSTDGSGNFVNFVPRGGVQMTFASDAIWFPLRLTQLVSEPASYVALDILTPVPLNAEQLPAPFELGKTGRMSYHGVEYEVARVSARLEPKQAVADLKLEL